MTDEMIIILMTRLAAEVLLAYRGQEDFKCEIERRIKEIPLPAEYWLPICFEKMAKELLAAI